MQLGAVGTPREPGLQRDPEHATVRWFYGWNVIGVALLFQAVVLGPTFSSFTLFVAPWMNEFGVTRGQVMLVIPVVTVGAGLFAALGGRLLDRYSIRALICLGVIEFAGALALLSIATRFWHVLAIYALLIAQAMVFAGSLAAQTLAAKWFRARRGLAIGVVSVGASIAGFAFPPLMALLIREGGWRHALLMLAPWPVIFVVPIVWLLVRNSPEDKGVKPEDDSGLGTVRTGGASSDPIWTTRQILGSSNFWIPILVLFPALTAFTGINFNLAPYSADHGIDAQRASFLLSIIAITGFAGRVFFGAMADRVDHRILIGSAVVSLIVAIVLLIGSPDYPRMIVTSLLLGFSGGSFLPLTGAILASRFGPGTFGRVMGMAMPFLTLAFLGAPFAGWMRDRFGGYESGLQILLAATLLGSTTLVRLRPFRPRTSELTQEIANER